VGFAISGAALAPPLIISYIDVSRQAYGDEKVRYQLEGINEFLELTGAERSRRTGISVETWSRFRNGKRSPKVNRVAEIAPAFG
jgi:transcriptional regulator with XRE-family HTH domain